MTLFKTECYIFPRKRLDCFFQELQEGEKKWYVRGRYLRVQTRDNSQERPAADPYRRQNVPGLE